MPHLTRKLLYHRGIDDGQGTYITDYVEAAFGVLFGIHLCVKLYQYGNRHHYLKTLCVVVALFSLSMSALLGGLAHQYLQTVSYWCGFAVGFGGFG